MAMRYPVRSRPVADPRRHAEETDVETRLRALERASEQARQAEERSLAASRLDEAVAAAQAHEARYEMAQRIIRHERTATLEARRQVDEVREAFTRALDHAEAERTLVVRQSEARVAQNEAALAAMRGERVTTLAALTRAERAREALEGSLARMSAERSDALESLTALFAQTQETHADLQRAQAELAHARREAPPRPAALAPMRLLPVTARLVVRIPGVNESEVARLRCYGVNTCDALLYADLVVLAHATTIGLPRLTKLRALAELMTIGGVEPSIADHAFRAGARSIRDLAAMGRRELEAVLRAAGVDDAELGHRMRVITIAARHAVEAQA